MCNCIAGGGNETVLPRPDWLPEGERVKGVPVDACIAEAVARLWAHGLRTLGSCCGHGTENPSLVIPSGEDAQPYCEVLRAVDGREWSIHQWQLVAVPDAVSAVPARPRGGGQ